MRSEITWAKPWEGLGHHVHMTLLNDRLNASEKRLRARVGSRKVTALIKQFRTAANNNPKLWEELYAKRSPYAWLARHWAPKQQPTNH